jgi:hypothetical protein
MYYTGIFIEGALGVKIVVEEHLILKLLTTNVKYTIVIFQEMS